MAKEYGVKLNSGNIYLKGYSAHHPDPLNVNQINLSAALLKHYQRSVVVSSNNGKITGMKISVIHTIYASHLLHFSQSQWEYFDFPVILLRI